MANHFRAKALTPGTTGTGVDLVVIGMPYSDPMMDGTVIQHVTTGALERGVRTDEGRAVLLVGPEVDTGATGHSIPPVVASTLPSMAEHRPALVGYFPVGHPSVPHSIDAMKALTTGTTGTGVDLVVIGTVVLDKVPIGHNHARSSGPGHGLCGQ
jgi:hypothetical protein